MYVYIESEPGLWTVGHYNPSGEWVAESDHDDKDEAAARAHYLNGGTNAELLAACRAVIEQFEGAVPVRGLSEQGIRLREAVAKAEAK